MKIQIDGQEILDIDSVNLMALKWRLVDFQEWLKMACIGQISHARDEMVSKELQRIKGKEVGVPRSMSQDHMIEWLSLQPNYKDAQARANDARDAQINRGE